MPDKYDNNNKRKRVLVIIGSAKGVGRTIATEFAKADKGQNYPLSTTKKE